MLGKLRQLAELTLTVAGCGLLVACSDDEPEQGQVMVVVTSDMAVPTDFDTITWSVTLPGDSLPFATSSFGLERGEDLPATLSVQSGPKTTKPVTIRIEGRKSGANDILRVAREARLVVPTDRTAELSMPLNWLCSDANSLGGCSEGETCQAGTCVDARIDSTKLPDYRTGSAEVCLDVATCVRERGERVPPYRDETGECVITGTRLGESADVTIALVVDKDSVGSYGFCEELANECYVMLSRDDREGFRVTTTGATPTVTLPSAVCEAVKKSIKTVSLEPRRTGCPSSIAGRSLCTPLADLCLDADPEAGSICPTDWPTSWVGYACSGSATPEEQKLGLLDCWDPPHADTAPAGANGRACCMKGEEPSTVPYLIDDMSGGPQIKITPPNGMIAGTWWTSLGDGSGSIEPALPPALFTYRTFDTPEQLGDGTEIKAAACAKSSGFLGQVALMGFHYVQAPYAGGDRPYDLSAYKGINFWGRAEEPFPGASLTIQVVFPNKDTHYNDPNATCWSDEYQSRQCDAHHFNVPLGETWTRHYVDFDELKQSIERWSPPQIAYDFDPSTVYSTSFMVKGGRPDVMSQPFDFCIANVYFTPKDQPESSP
jgi:hypothetical protein